MRKNVRFVTPASCRLSRGRRTLGISPRDAGATLFVSGRAFRRAVERPLQSAFRRGRRNLNTFDQDPIRRVEKLTFCSKLSLCTISFPTMKQSENLNLVHQVEIQPIF